MIYKTTDPYVKNKAQNRKDTDINERVQRNALCQIANLFCVILNSQQSSHIIKELQTSWLLVLENLFLQSVADL